MSAAPRTRRNGPSARRRKKVKPRTSRVRADAERPEIVLQGNTTRFDAVEKALEPIDARIRRGGGIGADDLGEQTIAVVLVEPLPAAAALTRTVADVYKAHPNVAVFTFLEHDPADRRARMLYSAGATAVLEWPRDTFGLSDLVAELIGVQQVRGPAQREDVAMARTAKAFLRVTPDVPSDVKVKMWRGRAFVSGSVPTLWHANRIEETLSRVPGVQATIGRGLWVPKAAESDRRLAATVRGLIRASSVDGATVASSVSDGIVQLAGVVGSRAEARRLVELIRHVRGVRGIEDLTTVSSQRQETDRRIAARLSQRLARVFPDQPMDVTVFSGTAVLRGDVPLLATKRDVESTVREDDSVRRVVSKIRIGEMQPGRM